MLLISKNLKSVQDFSILIDSRLHGNDVIPAEAGIQKDYYNNDTYS
jgi:hypothetical protein